MHTDVEGLSTHFVNQSHTWLCSFCFQLNTEDTSFIEAVEQFLEGWASLLEYSGLFPKGIFSDSATKILNCYVQCHLAAPDGLRGTFSHQIDNGIHLDEICDLDSDDRELFVDQLCTIGSFGRLIPDHALNLLTKLLETRVDQFEKYLSAIKYSTGMYSWTCITQSPCMSLFPLSHHNVHLYWVLTSIRQLLSPLTESQQPFCMVSHNTKYT